MKKQFTLLLVLLITLGAAAQKQANNWFFGESAGLSFASNPPSPNTNGNLSTMEGSASISNENGDLLFYSDGMRVWNSNNTQMPNGNGLLGDPSSTQSCIIIPKPNSDHLYYVFTIDDVANGNGGENGLNYTLVDMDLDEGRGDVVNTVKNVNLTSPMCEKLTAIIHANETDVWVVAQKWETNHFYSYLLTEDGVAQDPIISEAGIVISGSIHNGKGYMKISADGTRLAKANAGLHSVEIFYFNDETGDITNPLIISGGFGEPYGLEFSQNTRLLYVNTWKNNGGMRLIQYDLDAGSIEDIINSRFDVATGTEGALQLAPDDHIYVAVNNSDYLSRIKYPNKIEAGCEFEEEAVYLENRTCRWGLPNFMQSYFRTLTDVETAVVDDNCFDILPNPNNGKFNLVINETLSNPDITIFDLHGKLIYQTKTQSPKGEGMEMDLDFVNSGLYFINLSSENKTQTKKLIID